MQRIIFIPQFPTKLRYQEWWFDEFPEQFIRRGFDVVTLGEQEAHAMMSTADMFSPIKQAIEFETLQIREYMELDLREDDILFWSDLSFPGLFGHVLMHKRPSKMYAFCHATSKNNLDYYEPVQQYKFPIETALSKMFNKVFVGSKYHQDKLGWNNTMVTYLPFQPKELFVGRTSKTIDIMSASRKNPQKVDIDLENELELMLNVKIARPVASSWFNYFWNLQKSKILLITAHEDTFGYQIVDAITNNCIPLARRDLAYPELLPDEYLYSDKEELFHKVNYILNANVDWVPKVGVPKLLCEEGMNNFYDVICNEMKGE